MIQKFSKENFDNARSKDLLDLQCELCSNIFKAPKNIIQICLKGSKEHKLKFCSKICLGKSKSNKQQVECKNCNKIFLKLPSQLKKSPNSYCSRSCAATYNNTHKTHGTKRSKLEKYIEEVLLLENPLLEIHFNRKDAINSELDVYIPSLKLAFEFNGVFHYEPIFGQDKLEKTQNNDKRKFQACLEKEIELCIIDVSSMVHFKIDKAQKYLNIIKNIINKKVSE